jgi:hypothetical protein
MSDRKIWLVDIPEIPKCHGAAGFITVNNDLMGEQIMPSDEIVRAENPGRCGARGSSKLRKSIPIGKAFPP